MVKEHLHLSEADRAYLQQLVARQNVPVKVYRRAQGLLGLDQGQTLQQAAACVEVNYNTVAAWRDGYQAHGLQVLEDKARSGRPIQIEGPARAHITALACSTPPEGHGRWTMSLLADKAVELGFVESISRSRVAVILKKTLSSRT